LIIVFEALLRSFKCGRCEEVLADIQTDIYVFFPSTCVLILMGGNEGIGELLC